MLFGISVLNFALACVLFVGAGMLLVLYRRVRSTILSTMLVLMAFVTVLLGMLLTKSMTQQDPQPWIVVFLISLFAGWWVGERLWPRKQSGC